LPGKERKSGSEAGNRKSENPYSSRIFILGLPRLSRVGALPKLDVAGSTPVARSTKHLMGITVLEIEVANPARPSVAEKIDFLVDSGAIYSVVPASVLRKLGIKPLRAKEEFRLADGSKIERRKGIALFRYERKEGRADVIFGEPGDSTLLGALTLEALGLALDPIRRELKPLPMILAGWRPELDRFEVRAALRAERLPSGA